ncbi:hypothetical protein ACFPPD_14160 [Cohnella suwonensis]|uniref:Uncharacterized protein n=1 Tax=Cohnella suwonensis TaxID=696072 RepID=A0ABW0LVG7_9BACL
MWIKASDKELKELLEGVARVISQFSSRLGKGNSRRRIERVAEIREPDGGTVLVFMERVIGFEWQ